MIRDYRSHSCYSDITALMGGPHAPLGPNAARRPSRAFLLRQKSTGEEVVVMMTPIKASGVNAKTVVSRVPAYVANSGKITTPPRKKTRFVDSGKNGVE